MNVRQLIDLLLDCPMDADVVIDTDDGLRGNFQEIRHVGKKQNTAGEIFVVLAHERGE